MLQTRGVASVAGIAAVNAENMRMMVDRKNTQNQSVRMESYCLTVNQRVRVLQAAL
jgi:hypothetical protein